MKLKYIDEILKLSQKGHTPKEIKLILNISYYKVLKHFKYMNLPLQGSGGMNIIVKNNPFMINNNESNYWIGFLAADGCVAKRDNQINLKIKDVEHLKKYRDFISPFLNIYYKPNKKNELLGTVVFSNRYIKNYLCFIGIVPAKSRILKLNIPLNWHIIRGVFDGDGSISNNRPKITTGSEKFKNQLIDFFNLYKITTSVCIKGNQIYDIYIIGNSRFLFFNLMYENSTIKLDRKYNKYRAALEKFRVFKMG